MPTARLQVPNRNSDVALGILQPLSAGVRCVVDYRLWLPTLYVNALLARWQQAASRRGQQSRTIDIDTSGEIIIPTLYQPDIRNPCRLMSGSNGMLHPTCRIGGGGVISYIYNPVTAEGCAKYASDTQQTFLGAPPISKSPNTRNTPHQFRAW